MSAAIIERRLRAFLLALAAALALGTLAELWLTEHTQSGIQLIPFLLCGAALIAILAVALRPQRATILLLRAIMAAMALGSLIGGVQHIQGNLEFVREIHPAAAGWAQLWEALHGGAPLLAPGALAVAAAVAIAATYYHPALGRRSDP